MSTPSKQRGTKWERDIADTLTAWWPSVDRLVLHGVNDKGDIANMPGRIVVEAKWLATYPTQSVLEGWLDEAEREASNAGSPVGVVWWHRRGKASPLAGNVSMHAGTYLYLVAAADGARLRKRRGDATAVVTMSGRAFVQLAAAVHGTVTGAPLP